MDGFFSGLLGWLILSIAAIWLLAMALFGAVLFLHRRHDARAARWKLLEEAWEDTLLDILSGKHPTQSMHEAVAPKDALFFVQYLWRYHKTLMGSERDKVREMAVPYLGMLAPRLNHPMPETRARAVATLSTLGITAFEREIVAAVDDASDLVAMQAARGLAQGQKVEHIPVILARLGRYRAWSTGFLVSMLSSMGAAAAPFLRQIFSDASRPPRERALAALALADLDDYDAAAPAVAICGAESDPELLEAALVLLGQVGENGHLGIIRGHKTSLHAGVRAQALRSLGKLGGEDEWLDLLFCMRDPSANVRLEAAQGIKKSGGEQLLRELARSLDERSVLAKQVLEAGT